MSGSSQPDYPTPKRNSADQRPEMTRAINRVSSDNDTGSFEFDEANESNIDGCEVESLESPEAIKKIGDYAVEKKIGEGGMGQVYLARHETMDRKVALKVLPKGLSKRPKQVARFYEEIRAVGKLMHPNIVTAFDAGVDSGIHYLAMELVDGTSLSELVAKNGPLSQGDVIAIIGQLCTALMIAHDYSIVHRDIKPGNLMLTKNGTLKVLDFGLASLSYEVDQSVSKKQIIGTVEYMAPEQIDRPEISDPRSDLYAVGATLFFLLTGRTMFSGEAVQVAIAQLKQQPPAIYEVAPEVDLRIDALFQRLIAKDPSDRFNSAKDVVEHLESLDLFSLTDEQSQAARRINESFNTVANLSTSGTNYATDSDTFAAIGIDLGMLSTKASYLDDKRQLHEISFDDEGTSLRQFLWSKDEKVAIGEAAQNLRAKYPDEVFFGIQRWFGLSVIERKFGGRVVPPEVLLAATIKKVADAARVIQKRTSHAVVTIPACYDQLHRDSIYSACRIGGLEVLQLLDKPVAASLAFREIQQQLIAGGNESPDFSDVENLLVVSVGSCATEASIIQIRENVAQSMGNAGDCKLNKMRWQKCIADYFVREFRSKYDIDVLSSVEDASVIQRTVESLIQRLSIVPKVNLSMAISGQNVNQEFDRDAFIDIVAPLINETRQIVATAISKAPIPIDDIHQIILVGDLAGIPQLQKAVLSDLPSGVPIRKLEQSDIARGAAFQARHLLPPTDNSLPHGVTSASHDIALLRSVGKKPLHQPAVIIKAGEVLPTTVTKRIRFESMREKIEGCVQLIESTKVKDGWFQLGDIDIRRAFPNLTPQDSLHLRVELDSSGMLTGTLSWLNEQLSYPISARSTATMDDVTIQHWKDWLETLLLAQ